MVLAFKSDMRGDTVSREDFDTVATVLFVLFVPLCALACVAHKWRSVVQADMKEGATKAHTAKLQRAFGRLRHGRDTTEVSWRSHTFSVGGKPLSGVCATAPGPAAADRLHWPGGGRGLPWRATDSRACFV
jgi:hypothetical protein